MAKQMTPLPDAKSVRVNPTAEELKELAAQMPNAQETRYGNLNVQTRVLARSKGSTFLVVEPALLPRGDEGRDRLLPEDRQRGVGEHQRTARHQDGRDEVQHGAHDLASSRHHLQRYFGNAAGRLSRPCIRRAGTLWAPLTKSPRS